MSAMLRIASCFIIYCFWKNDDTPGSIDYPFVFSTLITELSLELPLYFELMMIFSLLFSTYKLYLILQEMIGSNEDEDLTQSGVNIDNEA